jgi:sugar O-acyltransferase (sialic acid O-acetyltransferase NeuD family)
MLIIGAKGFAKEVLEILCQLNELEQVAFYDDVNSDVPKKLFHQFPVLKNFDLAANYFETIDNRFTIGIGNPVLRKQLYDKFTNLGGKFTSTISPLSTIGSYDVQIGIGSNVLSGVVFSNNSTIGVGCIVYYNSIITHDCIIGNFVEISPSVTILGRCIIGSYTQIGANVTILPDVIIGVNVIIAAGAVVTKDVPNNCMVAGIPAVIKKELTPLAL